MVGEVVAQVASQVNRSQPQSLRPIILVNFVIPGTSVAIHTFLRHPANTKQTLAKTWARRTCVAQRAAVPHYILLHRTIKCSHIIVDVESQGCFKSLLILK